MAGCLREHHTLTNIHRIHKFEYANEAARLAATGFTTDDIGKVAHEVDSSTYWVLADDSPIVWKLLTGPYTKTVTAGASATTEADRVPLANFCSIEYTICIFNLAQNKHRTYKVLVSKTTTTNISDSKYQILGLPISAGLNFYASGTDAVFDVVNSEAFALTVRISKALL